MPTQNISGGPNDSATIDSGGASRMREMALAMPPTAEE